MPGFVGTYLGPIEDYSRISDLGIIKITLKQQFLDNVKQLINIAFTNLGMPPDDGKSLVEKLVHLASMLQGEGRGQTFALTGAGQDGGPVESPQRVVNNLMFHAELVEMQLYKRVSVWPSARRRVTMYTGASCEPQNPPLLPKVVLSYLLADKRGEIGSHMEVIQEVRLVMREMKTDIAHGEALALVSCFTSESERLRWTSVLV